MKVCKVIKDEILWKDAVQKLKVLEGIQKACLDKGYFPEEIESLLVPYEDTPPICDIREEILRYI